jgi:hypothetical protein
VDIRGTFGAHSGNVRCTFGERSVTIHMYHADKDYALEISNLAKKPLQANVLQALVGNIRGTFGGHSGNVRCTFGERSVHIWGTFGAHSGNVE